MLLSPDHFAQALKPAREAKSLTQREVATALGISVRAYQGYERGETAPPYEKARRLIELLGLEGGNEAATPASGRVSEPPAPFAAEVAAAAADPYPRRHVKPGRGPAPGTPVERAGSLPVSSGPMPLPMLYLDGTLYGLPLVAQTVDAEGRPVLNHYWLTQAVGAPIAIAAGGAPSSQPTTPTPPLVPGSTTPSARARPQIGAGV